MSNLISIKKRREIVICWLIVVGWFSFSVSYASAQSARETIKQTLPRVVKIFGAGGVRGLESYGTGMIVSPQGHIATVFSHVLDADEVSVVLNDGRRFDAEVFGVEPQLDLAILKLRQGEELGLDLPYFDVSKAKSAVPGTPILGFSNMFKVAAGDEPVSVLHGVIAARTELRARKGTFRVPYTGAVYIVDAITNNPGAGGGVIMSHDGDLLGIIGKELRNSDTNTWVNYAVPLTELKEAIPEMIAGSYRPKSPLEENADGPPSYVPLDFGLVLVPDVVYRTPAYVDSVVNGSPAAELGLQPDDLVLFVNDELVQSCRMLRDELGRLEAGDPVRMIVRRGNELINVEMKAMKKDAP